VKILVTNDDSINSRGLKVLVEQAKKYGDVVVVAPMEEQSGKSHSINIKGGLDLQKVDKGFEVETYSFGSTPADCVRAATHLLKLDFDMVLSGINNGMNLGEDIFYSGTVAGATEGLFTNKLGLAFSTYPDNFDVVATHFDSIVQFIEKHGLMKIGKLYNINVPYNPKGIKLTFQGNTHFDTNFVFKDDLHHPSGKPQYEKEKNNVGSDVWAIINEYISITPLVADRTDYNILNSLKNN
jgi:5'-nucleotidase